MKILFYSVLVGAFVFGGWCLWEFAPSLGRTSESRDMRTLEARYTAEQIMEAHRGELLKTEEYTYLEPQLAFYPHLLMDVKYTKDDLSTGEGSLLWSLTDGEMVLDACTWEKTHGYEDCLAAKADKNDFRILKALIENVGTIDRDQLYQQLNVESSVLDKWIENCRSKKLIVMHDNKLRLHLKNPRIEITPVTKLEGLLVSLPKKQVEMVKKHYTVSQIQQLATLSFGEDFAIRKMSEVFLPVVSISVQNPDGSVLKTKWNAVNGNPMLEQR